MPDFVCPKCGSGHLRRSHTRGFSEKLKKVLGWRAYRCREKPCSWRGLIKTMSSSQALGKELKNRQKLIFNLFLFMAAFIAAIYLVILFSSTKSTPS